MTRTAKKKAKLIVARNNEIVDDSGAFRSFYHLGLRLQHDEKPRSKDVAA